MPKKCKVIALANQKGGTAKTTTALNLGIGLAGRGKRVLLVDADPQGDLTTALGWTEADSFSVTLASQMEKIIRDEPFLYNEGILHHDEGVDLVPTNIELSGIGCRKTSDTIKESRAVDGQKCKYYNGYRRNKDCFNP